MDMSSDSDDFEIIVNDFSDDYLLALSLQSLEEELNSEENKNRKSIVKSDYELALHLSLIDGQTDTDSSTAKTSVSPKDVVSPELELKDPNPNIWHLMRDFDDTFFGGVLAKHCIELSWSSKMTRTAGLCAWSPTTNYCSIRLSLPLLQLRSRKDLVETLIHEMIHALLFVTREDDNHESHGNKFHEHMYRINRESGANITVYHSFHDEVNHFLKHIWRCDGQCRTRPPYYGYVRRSMNRKPGPHDYWFKFHEKSCGGTFIKESEPPKESQQKQKQVLTQKKPNNKDIRDYLSPTKTVSESISSQIIPFTGYGFKLGSKSLKNISTNSDSKVNQIYEKSNKNVSLNLKETSVCEKNSSTEKQTENKKIVSNIQTLNKQTGFESQKCDKNFDAFSGRGYVLGRRKPTKTISLFDRHLSQPSNSKTSAPKKSKIIDNIEVIEID